MFVFFRRRLVHVLALVAVLYVPFWIMIRMPGKSFRELAPPLSNGQLRLRDELGGDGQTLAAERGERNVASYAKLRAAADFIERSFSAAGVRSRRDSYEIDGRTCDNLEAELTGANR